MVDQIMDADWALDWARSDDDFSYAAPFMSTDSESFDDSNALLIAKAVPWNKMCKHHVATTYGARGKEFKRMFRSAGLSMNDRANMMGVMWKYHKGAGHSAKYHAHVDMTLNRYYRNAKTRAEKAEALKAALKELKEWIGDNPEVLRR